MDEIGFRLRFFCTLYLSGRLPPQVEQEAHGWAEHMGGALELLAHDDEGRPTDVVHRVFPRNNMLAFFQVGVDSFHQVRTCPFRVENCRDARPIPIHRLNCLVPWQVGEVLSLELPRLSINGWFHGPAVADPAPQPPLPQPEELKPHTGVVSGRHPARPALAPERQ